MSGDILIRNVIALDIATGKYSHCDILIVRGRIVDVSRGVSSTVENVVDGRGAYAIPGLIDCHVHVMAAAGRIEGLRYTAHSYATAAAAASMGAMLKRGFTTVRDTGGADGGLARAQREGLFLGPRLLFGGKALSQTGGHGDDRLAEETQACCCQNAPGLSLVVDGVDAVRAAARHALHMGADHLKVMAGGGVASPTDPIDSIQFSAEEIEAVVDEARRFGKYVAAHAYTPSSIQHALSAGVRTIEHANLIDAETLELVKKSHAFIVMNQVTYWAIAEVGRQEGMSPAALQKVDAVLDAGYSALERVAQSGASLAFGTDLLGGMQKFQSREFKIRKEFMPSIDILRSATSVAAHLLGLESEIGYIEEGFCGDVVLVNADPLEDIEVLSRSDSVNLVVQAGVIVHSNP